MRQAYFKFDKPRCILIYSSQKVPVIDFNVWAVTPSCWNHTFSRSLNSLPRFDHIGSHRTWCSSDNCLHQSLFLNKQQVKQAYIILKFSIATSHCHFGPFWGCGVVDDGVPGTSRLHFNVVYLLNLTDEIVLLQTKSHNHLGNKFEACLETMYALCNLFRSVLEPTQCSFKF